MTRAALAAPVLLLLACGHERYEGGGRRSELPPAEQAPESSGAGNLMLGEAGSAERGPTEPALGGAGGAPAGD